MEKINKKKIIVSILLLVAASFLVLAVSFNLWDDREIGYEFLDDGEVVHIWNTQYDYFFDKDKGIQLTNHYEDYWTKNIFCIGYYNLGTWNKIACADELTNFNKNIHSDNLTYVNATLWKDITYGPYDLRLGINYYLGLDDKNLSVSVYGKNIGVDIPYDLGFAWKVTDWEIPHDSPLGDSIFINDTNYNLNGTFDLLFKNMTKSYDITLIDNETNISTEQTFYSDIPFFRGYDNTKFLRIDWDKDLNYAVKMVGNGNQSEFYVALLINAGHFDPGQEKSTTFQWIDAEGDYIEEVLSATALSLVMGVTTDGTNVWVADYTGQDIHKWDMAGNYIGMAKENIGYSPTAIKVYGDYFYVCDRSGDKVYVYNKADWSDVTNWAIQGEDPYGITSDGNFIWIMNSQANRPVYKYDMDGVYQDETWNAHATANLMGLATDGNFIWALEYAGYVHKYEMDGTNIPGDKWDIRTQGTARRMMDIYGGYAYITDSSTEKVTKYEAILAVGDETLPNVTIVTPTNTTYNTNTIVFNFTAVDETAMDSCFYQIDGGANRTMSNTSSSYNATNSSMTQGSHTIRALCNDTSDNFNLTETVVLFIDSIYPKISITSPTNGTNTTDTGLDVKYTYTETNCDRTWWTNVTTNLSLGCGNNITNVTWAEGKHNLTIWMNDTANNVNSTNISFTIDTTNPLINLVYPTNTTYTSVQIELNFSYSDINVDSCWYSTDGGITNTTHTTCANITGLNSGQGSSTWLIGINDTSGNENYSIITFFVDSILPIQSITYPENITYSENVSELNYTYTETNPDSCWYSTNNGVTNSSRVDIGTNFTDVVSVGGSNTWILYCNDTAGNENLTSITFNLNVLWSNSGYPFSNKSFRISEFINVSGTNFTLGGETYRFLGADSYYLADYATNLTYDDDGNEINNSKQYVLEILNEAQYLNINVIRTWASSQGSDDSHWIINESGGHFNLFERGEPGNYSEEMFQALDWVIYEASKRDIRLQLVLINNWNDYGGMRWYAQKSPTTDKTYEWINDSADDNYWLFHDQFYTDENCRQYFRNYINHTLERNNTYSGLLYKDDPAIFSWLLANEPRAKSDGIGRTIISNWTTNMTAYIKSIDTNHLVGLGIEGWGYVETWGEGTDMIADHNNTGVDFVTYALHPDQWKYFAERSEHTGAGDNWVTDEVDTNEYVDWWTNDTGVSFNNRYNAGVPAYTPALGRENYDNWVSQNVQWANELGMPVLLQELGYKTSHTKELKDRFYEQTIHNFYNEGGDGLMFWTLNHDNYYYSTDINGTMDDTYGFYLSDDPFLQNKSESVIDAINFTKYDDDGDSWITELNPYKYDFILNIGFASDTVIDNCTLYLNVSNGTWSGYYADQINSTPIIDGEDYTFTTQFDSDDEEFYWYVQCFGDSTDINSTVTHVQVKSATPIINLRNPINNTNISSSSIDFIYNISNTINISYCELYIDDNVNKTDYTVSIDVNQNFSVSGFVDSTYNWSIECTDIDSNIGTSVTNYFTIDTTPPTITFISQTPSDFMWNSTETPEILINITDVSGINESSVVFFHGVNHTDNGLTHWNWSNRILDVKSNDFGWRAENRNESKWWESIIYKELVNDIWSFSGHDIDSDALNVINNSTTHSYFNFTEHEVHKMFPSTWYVDRTDLTKENKTDQFINIYKNRPVKIAYNLTIHDLTENFTSYDHLNIETQGSSYDLVTYICNSTYATGNPTTNDNCQAGFHITGTDTRTVAIANSSYIDKTNGGTDGSYGQVILTEKMSLVLFTSEPVSGNAYKLYFANNTIADNTNFNETNVMWTSGNNGIAWTQFSGTPDFWYSPAIEDHDKVVYYVYACDELGNCVNSTWQIDTLQAEPNQPPINPTITYPQEYYNVSIPFHINWTTAGDPDGDSYNASIYLYNQDGTLNITLADNNITNDITYFNVTDLVDGTYRINITLCDDSDACSSTLSGWNFTVEYYSTNVTICRNLWEENVTYTLQNNITTTSLCFTITANNITFDMNGFSLKGDCDMLDDGVYIGSYNDTTVKNGRLDNFYRQIYVSGAYRTNLTNMTFNGSCYADVYNSMHDSFISDITGLGGSIGLWMAGDNNTLDNVNISRYDSIALHVSGDYNTIKNSFSRYNTGAVGRGISITGRYNNITNNTFESNQVYEIRVTSDDNIFYGNTIWNCSSSGCIFVDNADNNTFDRNKINFSKGEGIIIESGFINSEDNLFKNTNMTNINLTAVNLTDAGGLNNTFINFTYEDESVDTGSQLIRRWYYRAYVNDSDGIPMDNVIVSIENSTADNLFNLTTSSGYTRQISLVEYINSGTSSYHSNYTLVATDVLGNLDSHSYNTTTNELKDVFTIIAGVGGGGGAGGGAEGEEHVTTPEEIVEVIVEEVTDLVTDMGIFIFSIGGYIWEEKPLGGLLIICLCGGFIFFLVWKRDDKEKLKKWKVRNNKKKQEKKLDEEGW